jgi:hypothetical protein
MAPVDNELPVDEDWPAWSLAALAALLFDAEELPGKIALELEAEVVEACVGVIVVYCVTTTTSSLDDVVVAGWSGTREEIVVGIRTGAKEVVSSSSSSSGREVLREIEYRVSIGEEVMSVIVLVEVTEVITALYTVQGETTSVRREGQVDKKSAKEGTAEEVADQLTS